jgi:tetratricopeptide (TPR) repeat protein
MKKSISLLFIFFLFQLNCASREFKSVHATDSSANLSPAEKIKYKEAVQIVNQGNKEFQLGHYKEAIAISEKSFETFPTAEGYYLSGVSYHKLGKNEKAVQELEAGRAIDSKNQQILITLALVKTTLGEEEEALSIYEDLAKYYPKEPVYVFKKAVQEKALAKYDVSLASFKSIDPSTFPQKAELYSQLGDVSMKLKNYADAEKYFALASEASPNSESAKSNQSTVKTASYLENGNRAMVDKNYDKAIVEYTKASEVDTKNPSPLVFLANAFILKGDYRQGEISLNKSLKLNDEYQPSYETYSALYYREKRYKDSLTWAKKGIGQFPRSERLWNRQALAEWKLGDAKSAALSFRKATEINPKFIESDKNLSYLLIEEKRFRDAKNILLELSKKDSNSQNDYKKIILFCEQSELIEKGDRLLQLGKINDANKFYSQALKLNPNEPSVHNAFGRSYFLLNAKTKSEASFQKALSLDKENLPALIGLIRIFSSRKEHGKEKEYLAKLNALTEGDPTAGILVARLKEDNGDMKGAETAYLELKKKYPEDPAISYRLASLYFKMAVDKNSKEEYESALSYLKKAEKENPKFPDIAATEKVIHENLKFDSVLPIIKQANQFYDRKKFKDAAELYNEGYLKTNKPTLLVKVAECYVGMGEEEKALNLLEASASKEKTGFTDFREAINSYYFSKGDAIKAEKGFQNILIENPNSFYSYYKLGLIELSRKNFDKAIENIDKSLILNYNFPAGNVAKGVAYHKKGDVKQAKEEFNRAMDKEPGLDIASYNIGILFFNQDMDTEARKIFHELNKKNPDFSESYHQLSYLDFKQGKYQPAEENILKALSIERNPAYLYAYLRILESKKDKAKWKTIAREMNEKFPSSPYTSKLRSDAFQDDPLYFQAHDVLGDIVSQPILVGDLLVSNYGTSLVASDVRSRSRKWRTVLKEKFETILFDLRLFGANEKSIVKWDMESGSEVERVSLNLKKGSQFSSFVNKDGNFVVISHNEKSTSLTSFDYRLKRINQKSYNGNFNILVSPDQKEILAWDKYGNSIRWEGSLQEDFPKLPNWNKSTGIVKSKIEKATWIDGEPVLVSREGILKNGSFKSWGFPVESIHLKTESILLRSDDSIFEWKNGTTEELKFAKGMKDIIPVTDGYISWDIKNQVRFHKPDGTTIAMTKAPSDWSKASADLSTLFYQGLDRSK